MQHRFVPRPTAKVVGEAFATAQDAWLWAAHAVRFSAEGAHLTANRATTQRPCEPRDIITLACRLRRQDVLSGVEFGTLCKFGALDRPPDPRDRAEESAARVWDRALDKLTGPLVVKGIVEPPFRVASGFGAGRCSKGTYHE